MTEMFIGWRITPQMGQGSAPPPSPTAQLLGAHSECSSSPLKLSLGLVTVPSLVLPAAGPLWWILGGSWVGSHLLPFRTRVSFQTRQTRRALWENKRGDEFMSHSFIQLRNSWSWMLWTYHWAWRTIWARRSRETLFTL